MAARRKPKHDEPLPDACGRFYCRLPEQWSEIDQTELQRRHDTAKLLIAGRLPPGYLQGSSTGSLFDD